MGVAGALTLCGLMSRGMMGEVTVAKDLSTIHSLFWPIRFASNVFDCLNEEDIMLYEDVRFIGL